MTASLEANEIPSVDVPKWSLKRRLRPLRIPLAGCFHCDRLFVLLPSPSMPTFLTMKEAATVVGKSPSSIRRVIYPIIEDDKHPDRKHIRPTVDEVAKLRVKGENFAWRVSEDFLRREVPIGEASSKPGSTSDEARATAGSDALIEMLRKELDIKNHQITQQSEMMTKQIELISGLSERLREGNILIGSLQQQLALPDGIRNSDIVETKSTDTKPSEKGSRDTTEPADKKTHWLFRKIF